MAKYVYPAIFAPEENGLFAVSFPDVEECLTSGESLIDAMEMATDALALILAFKEENGQPIPKATPIKEVKTDEKSFVTLVLCDTASQTFLEDDDGKSN